MKNNNIWLPLIASIGIGAAAFYSMSRNNNQGMDKIMQQLIPGGSNSGMN